MSKKLLIMTDNEPVTTRALALDLTDAGYDVEIASDRDEARRKSREARFDLLITPESPMEIGYGGFVDEFRSEHPAAKVVLMTTDGSADPPIEESEARVKKPFDLEEFRSVIGRLLEPTAGSAK